MILTLFAFLPEIVLLLLTGGVLIRGVLAEKSARETRPVPKVWTLSVRLALVFMLGAFFAYLWQDNKFHGTYFSGFLVLNPLILLGKVSVLGFGVLWTGIRFRFLNQPLRRAGLTSFEYPALMTLSLLGSCLIISSNNFICAYLGLELQVLPLYVAIAFRQKTPLNIEAGFKYFLLGTLASIFILYGVGLVYGAVGSTNFDVLSYVAHQSAQGNMVLSPWMYGGALFLLAGFLFKLAIFPFQLWVPDVYEGSSNTQVAFLGIVPKVAVLFLLVRFFLGPLSFVFSTWGPFLAWLGALSVLAGGVMALYQKKLRRLFGYGAVVHMGFVLMGLSTGLVSGYVAAILYMALYGITLSGLFIGLNTLQRDHHEVETLEDMAGLWQVSPMKALLFAVFLLSFAGLPPLAGFWGKFHILIVALKQSFYGPAILAVVGSVLSLFYYLRLIKTIFFEEGDGVLAHERTWSFALLLITIFLSSLMFFQARILSFIQSVF